MTEGVVSPNISVRNVMVSMCNEVTKQNNETSLLLGVEGEIFQ
jgi:hypothetical protein